ncbi:hypothetical protein BCV70DRAFT_108505 [Testicularia cyperi]|uniref:Uncharacterized protein n=1 Tax=Testicularia cyperi TaxID=1882483 RepID=A0A317XPX5_9BASI|nr:hypothetical protein BCV70DRAFT_108505 [Testicularia cyperi]
MLIGRSCMTSRRGRHDADYDELLGTSADARAGSSASVVFRPFSLSQSLEQRMGRSQSRRAVLPPSEPRSVRASSPPRRSGDQAALHLDMDSPPQSGDAEHCQHHQCYWPPCVPFNLRRNASGFALSVNFTSASASVAMCTSWCPLQWVYTVGYRAGGSGSRVVSAWRFRSLGLRVNRRSRTRSP